MSHSLGSLWTVVPLSSAVRGISQAGVGCYSLLQGISPDQGSNPHLLHWRWILYCWASWEATLLYTNFQAGGNGTVRERLSRLKQKVTPFFVFLESSPGRDCQARKTHVDAEYVLISTLNAPEVSVNNAHLRSNWVQFSSNPHAKELITELITI